MRPILTSETINLPGLPFSKLPQIKAFIVKIKMGVAYLIGFQWSHLSLTASADGGALRVRGALMKKRPACPRN